MPLVPEKLLGDRILKAAPEFETFNIYEIAKQIIWSEEENKYKKEYMDSTIKYLQDCGYIKELPVTFGKNDPQEGLTQLTDLGRKIRQEGGDLIIAIHQKADEIKSAKKMADLEIAEEKTRELQEQKLELDRKLGEMDLKLKEWQKKTRYLVFIPLLALVVSLVALISSIIKTDKTNAENEKLKIELENSKKNNLQPNTLKATESKDSL